VQLPIWLIVLGGYTPIALFVFAPMAATLARRRNRDVETWLLLGGAFGPLAVAWIALLAPRARHNDAERRALTRRRTPAHRVPTGAAARAVICPLCGEPQVAQHLCRAEVVEDRIQRRWTVRVGGQRILGG
jgi:hypothetical protein